MTRVLRVSVLAIAATLTSIGFVGLASSATPTPEATATSTATPEPRDLQLNYTIDPLVLYWEPTSGATTYHVFGSVSAVEVNAVDPFCTAAVIEQTKQFNIDAELPAGTDSFAVNTPPLPPADKWFVPLIQVSIVAQDETRATTATGGLTAVAEARCGGPVSPPAAIVFTEDTMVGDCLIPAGFIEVTTQSSIDHGQHVFARTASDTDRYYVQFRVGGCVHLVASAEKPFPEFIGDDLPLSPPNAAAARSAVSGPDTGHGSLESHRRIGASSARILAASAILLIGGGLALRARRR